jgi:hypothetical protein
MRSDKKNRMMANYNGFAGHQTVSHITSNIPTELLDQLTGKQLGLIMSALNKFYHQGKAESQKEIREYIGISHNVTLWDIIGDADYLGYKKFEDNLNIPDILSARSIQVERWKKEA